MNEAPQTLEQMMKDDTYTDSKAVLLLIHQISTTGAFQLAMSQKGDKIFDTLQTVPPSVDDAIDYVLHTLGYDLFVKQLEILLLATFADTIKKAVCVVDSKEVTNG